MAFVIKNGDRRPSFVVALKDNYGQPGETAVNLTTATGAVFNMRGLDAGAVKITRGTATISNAALGEVTYDWGATDTDTPGEYEAEVEITWADTKKETFPNNGYWLVTVTDDIA